MLKSVLVCAVVALASAKEAASVASLKESTLASASKFKLRSNDVFAKYSNKAVKVTLTEAQQRKAWNKVKGANFDAFAQTDEGIMLERNGQHIRCQADRGKEVKSGFVAHYHCDAVRFKQVMRGHPGGNSAHDHVDTPDGSMRTHPTLHDEKNQPHVHEGTYGGDPDFNERIRFWHRCANGPYNGLSLCKRYQFVGVDSQGYYGCSQLTANGYCVESFRHEWMEFNPDDLAFTVNPPNPCPPEGCDE
jgi:hypothetical protein